MEAADILEVYARVRGVSRVPVHVQRELERDGLGQPVDIPANWLSAACWTNDDCHYAGGVCKSNLATNSGYCSAACTGECAQRLGYPPAFCTIDTDDPSAGMCVVTATSQNGRCRQADAMTPRTVVAFDTPDVHATVCLP
jgi:hypothetical protein